MAYVNKTIKVISSIPFKRILFRIDIFRTPFEQFVSDGSFFITPINVLSIFENIGGSFRSGTK